MDKRKGVVIAIALLLLFGTGTFVFANPSDDGEIESDSGVREPVRKVNSKDEGDNSTSADVNEEETEPSILDVDTNTNMNATDTTNGNTSRNNGRRPNSSTSGVSNGSINSGNNGGSTNAGSSSSINTGNSNNNSGKSDDLNQGSSDGQGTSNMGNNSGNQGGNSGNEGTGGNQGGNSGNEETGGENPGGNGDNKPSTGDDNKNPEDEKNIEEAQDKLNGAKNDLTQDNIDEAKKKIDEIIDEAKKTALLKELELLQELLDLTNLVNELTDKINNATSKDDIDEARDLSTKNDIDNRLSKLEENVENSELINKINALKDNMINSNEILNDTEGPKILGISNGDVVNKVNIYYDESENSSDIKAYIGTKEISLESINNINLEGTYTIDFVDKSFNKTTITFTVDTTLPLLQGIKSHFNASDMENGIKILVNDASDTTICIEKNGVVTEIIGGEVIIDKSYGDGDYKIWAVDKALNKSQEFSFQIDTVSPVISGLESKTYNLEDIQKGIAVNVDDVNEVMIYVSKDGVISTILASNLVIDDTFTDGSYTIWALDGALNTSQEFTFEIDKTAPQYINFGIANNSRLNTDKNIYEASVGDEVTVFITFREELRVMPLIKVNDSLVKTALQEVRENGLYVYVGKYTVGNDTLFGEMLVTVFGYQDKNLNLGDELNNSNINHEYSKVIVVKNDTDSKDDDNEEEENGFEFVNNKTFSDGHMVIKVPGYAGMTIQDISNNKILGKTPDSPYTTTESVYDLVPNGAYIFTLYDADGNEILSVFMKYDSKKPIITGTGVVDGERKDLVQGETYESLDIKISDSALATVTITKDNGAYETKKFGNFNNSSYSKSFTESGSYKIVVVDKAGNESSIEFNIKEKTTLFSRMLSIIGVRI